jgi:hypothetical protein
MPQVEQKRNKICRIGLNVPVGGDKTLFFQIETRHKDRVRARMRSDETDVGVL